MSWSRFQRTRTAWPVWCAASAASAAGVAACVSLPPKPPPIRRLCTTTLLAGTLNKWATSGLHLGRVLRGGGDEHGPVLARLGPRRLRLQIEMLLPLQLEGARQRHGRIGQCLADLAAADEVGGVVETARRQRLLQRQDRAAAARIRPPPSPPPPDRPPAIRQPPAPRSGRGTKPPCRPAGSRRASRRRRCSRRAHLPPGAPRGCRAWRARRLRRGVRILAWACGEQTGQTSSMPGGLVVGVNRPRRSHACARSRAAAGAAAARVAADVRRL